MKVKIKKLNENAVLPARAHATDAGFDLVATSRVFDKHGCVTYGTGLAFEIPTGYVGLVFPRSSNAKKDLALTNSWGVIDSGYRGEVMFKFRPTLAFIDKEGVGKPVGNDPNGHEGTYEVGERIGQIIIMPYPEIEFEEGEELSDSDRGNGGYGSTGR